MGSARPAAPRSANDTTSTTPGCARARAASTRRMRAWACGLRSEHDVEHPGQGDVADVAPPPGEKARVLLAKVAVADELHAQSPSRSAAAPSSAASTMFW